MAAMVRSMVGARRRGFVVSRSSCLLQGIRHSHTQSLWEQILGRKIEPSTVKALEEAFLEFRVSKSVPSWLPFLPNSSFWIPSSEDTMKNLEVLAERVQQARPARRRHACPSFQVSPDLSADGVSSSKALSAIQAMDKLLDRLGKCPVEDGTTIRSVDATNVEDEDEDEDEDKDEDGDGDGDGDGDEDDEDEDDECEEEEEAEEGEGGIAKVVKVQF